MPAAFPSAQLPRRLLMGPGPSEVDPRVYRAMSQPIVGHLDPCFLEVLDQIQQMLRDVFRTRNALTLPIPGTGSAGMEAALINFIEPGDEVAVLVGGVFAARMGEIVERCGGKLIRIEHPLDTPAEPEAVRQALRGRNPRVLAAVHSETSTGVCQSLPPLREIAEEAGALLVVDAVSSLAGMPLEVDSWGVDVCYSGSQKCLSCPPGLAPITVGARAAERLRQRRRPVQSWYLDLSMVEKYWGSERRYHHTPPISSLLALHEALRLILREGLEATWARHKRSHRALVGGMEAMGLKMFVERPEDRAWTVNTVSVPPGVEEARVRGRLMERFAIEIGSGLGELKGRIWRIGLMGLTAQPSCVLMLFEALESALAENGFSCPRGAAVAAAEQILQTSTPGTGS